MHSAETLQFNVVSIPGTTAVLFKPPSNCMHTRTDKSNPVVIAIPKLHVQILRTVQITYLLLYSHSRIM